MSNLLHDIANFHEKFGLPPHDLGKLPPEIQKFRIQFLQEELDEYEKAVIKGDLEGQLDALVDLVYVALGTAYLSRFPFNSAWERVHDANMKKVRASSADQSKRNSTADVVKPEGWKPPMLTDLVRNDLKQMRTFIEDIDG